MPSIITDEPIFADLIRNTTDVVYKPLTHESNAQDVVAETRNTAT